ncbi:MAG: hypothetical protein BWK78_06040, partial [Thiotrichaceae bacterium IS1]
MNDLFIGPQSHISARYLIEIGNRKEQQSSSGIIISTGLGATGWFKSLISRSHAASVGMPCRRASVAWERELDQAKASTPAVLRPSGSLTAIKLSRVGVQSFNLGDIYLAQGQTESALTAYQKSLVIRERLAAQDP